MTTPTPSRRWPGVVAGAVVLAATVVALPSAGAAAGPLPGPAPAAQPRTEPLQRDAKPSPAAGFGPWRAPAAKAGDTGPSVVRRAPDPSRVTLARESSLRSALAGLDAATTDRLARQNGTTAAKLRAIAADPTARVDTSGGLLFVDPVDPAAQSAPTVEEATPFEAPFALGDTFFLHSKPGSTKTLYLDFDGYAMPAGTAWKGGAAYNAPAYDPSGDGAAFNATELGQVQSIWQRVAEDYAALDIDVTTQDPGFAAINRADAADTVFGGRVVITGASWDQAGICGSACGGVSYVGVVDRLGADHSFYQPSWVFAPNVAGAKATAEATSHEFGHAAGLSHDGTTTGSAYYGGHNQWAPIMGVGYSRPVVQFSRGEYTNANNTEDDYAVMASNGLAQRADDHGSAFGSGTPVYNGNATGGVIESSTDGDMFTFTSCGGPATITANPSPVSPNLDLRLFLYSAANGFIASNDPPSAFLSGDTASGMSATLTQNLTYGQTYQVWVDRASMLPATTGYSTYGTRGHYQVRIDQQASCDLYAWVDDATTPSYTVGNGRWANPAGAAPTVSHPSAGSYSVTFPGAVMTGGNVQVTATTPGVTCNSNGWGSATASVTCRDSGGVLVNSPFSLLYTHDDDAAYVWAHSPATASYTPTTVWSHNPSGRPITVNRFGAGQYTVSFPGYTGADGGQVQVVAYGTGAVRCVSNGWSDQSASVACRDTSGALVDSMFNLLFTKRQSSGYAWADQPASPSYSPSAYWAQNPSGGALTVSRSAVGRYKVKFAGVAGGNGNVQVVGYGANTECVVPAWSNDTALVACTDATGAYADSRFDVLYVPGSAVTCNNLTATVDLAVGDVPTAGNDVVNGTQGNDVVSTLDGSDTVCLRRGNDFVDGGPGNDYVLASDGDDIVNGGGGTDQLYGGLGADTMHGGNSTDAVYGQDGNDTLYGDSGNDSVFGGSGNDTVRGGNDVDQVFGEGGNDSVGGDPGAGDVCNGGPGTDVAAAGCESLVGIP